MKQTRDTRTHAAAAHLEADGEKHRVEADEAAHGGPARQRHKVVPVEGEGADQVHHLVHVAVVARHNRRRQPRENGLKLLVADRGIKGGGSNKRAVPKAENSHRAPRT